MSDDLGLGVYDERFQDPFAAADYLESIRWPDGPVCPHCGTVDEKHYRLKNPTRKLWKCRACRKQFTVTVGTIFEGSHIPLNKWLLAFYLLCSSKKGMSAHQLHRMLGVTYKSAWFMAHRIRYAMDRAARGRTPMSSGGRATVLMYLPCTHRVHGGSLIPGSKKGARRVPARRSSASLRPPSRWNAVRASQCAPGFPGLAGTSAGMLADPGGDPHGRALAAIPTLDRDAC